MLDLPIHPGVCDGCPVDPDVLLITKSNEFPTSELRAVVHNDGVRYSKAMDDVEEEQHGLLGFDHRDWSSFYPLCKLAYGDKQVGVAPRRLFEWSNQIESPDYERPGDEDRLECLGL